jgi:short-subunit dehydrogenase
MLEHKKNILITGASSGIGSALALQYANTNNHLVLLGRNEENLKAIAKRCEEKGATTSTVIADVCSEDYEKEISTLGTQWDFDLVIANAGQNLLERFETIHPHSTQQIRQLMQVNFEGQVKSVFPLLKGLERKKGHIIIMASIAALRGLPQDPAYCASKAALSTFFEGCRATWRKRGITMTLVYPGFVKTPMSEKVKGIKPFATSAENAAKRIQRAATNKKYTLLFPNRLGVLFNLYKLFPKRIVDWVLASAV